MRAPRRKGSEPDHSLGIVMAHGQPQGAPAQISALSASNILNPGGI